MGTCEKEKWDVKMLKKYFLFKRKNPVAICTPRKSKNEESWFSICCGFASFESGSLSLWTFRVSAPGMAWSPLCLL